MRGSPAGRRSRVAFKVGRHHGAASMVKGMIESGAKTSWRRIRDAFEHGRPLISRRLSTSWTTKSMFSGTLSGAVDMNLGILATCPSGK